MRRDWAGMQAMARTVMRFAEAGTKARDAGLYGRAEDLAHCAAETALIAEAHARRCYGKPVARTLNALHHLRAEAAS